MQQPSALRTVLFAAAVCAICSVVVATAAVTLRSRQEENQLLERRSQVLTVSGLVKPGEKLSRDEITDRFQRAIRPRIVDLADGSYVEEFDAATFDQRSEAADPETSRVAPPNQAGIRRLPQRALVYQVVEGDSVQSLILPIEGKGLWSTLYGYLALDRDTRTIDGITFYQHGETPGLGGEVDNPRWKGLWPGRKAFDEDWEPSIEVVKGAAGAPEADPYRVDGLSGATITSRGVSNLVRFWLGDDGFGPYLERFRTEGT